MAICTLNISAPRAILSLLLFAGLTMAASDARADLISNLVYHLTICGGGIAPQPGSSCYVQPAQHIPTQAELDGIQQAIVDFYSGNFPDANTWQYEAAGANDSGYVYGTVFGGGDNCGGMCVTQFIFHQGKILCCTVETPPYVLLGLNDNGIFIGIDEEGFWFASSEITPFDVEPHLPILDASSTIALSSLLSPPYNDPTSFFVNSMFVAVDNDNRISGIGPLGVFVLVPVPEPSSGALILSALGGLLYIGRRLNAG